MLKFRQKILFTPLTLVLLNLTVASVNSAETLEHDLTNGQRLYETNCTVCHGAKAQGNGAHESPALAGQSAAYLNRQLEHFSKGIRGASDGDNPDRFGQQMAAVSNQLKDSQARVDVSFYLASLTAPTTSVSKTKTGGGTLNGYKYYQSSCGSCHGGDISGNENLNTPSLAGLSAAYLQRQYQNFLNSRRGWHAEDKFGRQMRMIANTLPEQNNIDDVIAYIVSLNDTPPKQIND